MKENLAFDPFFLFKTAFQQTVFSAFLFNHSGPPSKTKHIPLKCGDVLALEVSTPSKWNEKDLTIVMLHGLCGSHKSGILVRVAKKLYNKNIRSARVNLRGCGTGKGLAQTIYHSGLTEDILEVLKTLKKEDPLSEIILVGYSLSGNMVLKLAGELEDKAHGLIKKVISLSPPVDLKESTRLFEQKENRVYLRYFINLLRTELNFLKKRFKKFTDLEMPKNMNFTQFNEKIIVPIFGFQNLDDYYEKCSSKFFIPKIQVPTRILFCDDDPIVSSKGLDDLELPDNISIYYTKKGGHLGYLTSPMHKHGFYWLDGLLLDWILNK